MENCSLISSLFSHIVISIPQTCRCRLSCIDSHNETHPENSKWNPDQCTTCSCDQGGRLSCNKTVCSVPCKDPLPPPPGVCCPVCLIKVSSFVLVNSLFSSLQYKPPFSIHIHTHSPLNLFLLADTYLIHDPGIRIYLVIKIHLMFSCSM